jgi:hypothetical protein
VQLVISRFSSLLLRWTHRALPAAGTRFFCAASCLLFAGRCLLMDLRTAAPGAAASCFLQHDCRVANVATSRWFGWAEVDHGSMSCLIWGAEHLLLHQHACTQLLMLLTRVYELLCWSALQSVQRRLRYTLSLQRHEVDETYAELVLSNSGRAATQPWWC